MILEFYDAFSIKYIEQYPYSVPYSICVSIFRILSTKTLQNSKIFHYIEKSIFSLY